MSIIRWLFSGFSAPVASSGDIGAMPFDVIQGSAMLRKTTAGEYVSPGRALTLSTWYACIKNIAEDVGKLPLKVYRRVGGGKEPASDLPLYDLLKCEPNDESSAATFRETLTGWALSWGNAYAEIQRDARGRPMALWPIHPSRSVLRRVEGEIFLDVYSPDATATDPAQTKPSRLPYADVLHIRGFGDHPLTGLSIAGLAAESLGVSLAAQTYGAAFFANGAIPSIVLTHPGTLSEPAQVNLRESWKKRYSGARNGNGVAVLQEGIKIEKLTIPPEEAQFLQTRQFQVAEIARWFRMPPHKIQSMESSTNNNIEQQALEYLTDTLLPWLVRWEQELTRKLLAQSERATLVIEHAVNGLLRGDAAARVNYYARMIQSGAMSPDEARAMENMNPIPGGHGAKFYMQGAMVPLDQVNSNGFSEPNAPNKPTKPGKS